MKLPAATVQAGGLLIVGTSGPVLKSEEAEILRRLQPGGVILFGRNVESEGQLLQLTAAIRSAAPVTLICVDAEGGRVDRLRAVVGSAPAAGWLSAEPTRKSEQAGRWIGQSLRAFDADVDFAPVVDLDHGASDNALDGRYLGREPRSVAARGRAFLRGLESAGISGCLKHFPGLGAAQSDTHHLPASVGLDREALDRDLSPFIDLLVDSDAVMIAHAAYPALDPTSTPATLSPRIATGLLRRELCFEGIAVSDDLEMKALDPWGDLAQRTLHALEAGCDALPICSRLGDTEVVADHLGRHADPARLRGAAQRWETWRCRLLASRESARRYRLDTVRRRLAALGSA
ncbi:MAG: beta-N-acetylhexosaminidase [Thermoanaerobaculia bacterium]|nr:beta-N-acetylhexosaminidase [Thermoanaerobaculia bacterium]